MATKGTKKSPVFEPSGLDEVFESLAKRKAEAIAKGWIIVAVSHDPKPDAEAEHVVEVGE